LSNPTTDNVTYVFATIIITKKVILDFALLVNQQAFSSSWQKNFDQKIKNKLLNNVLSSQQQLCDKFCTDSFFYYFAWKLLKTYRNVKNKT